jgi:hypothetical protein
MRRRRGRRGRFLRNAHPHERRKDNRHHHSLPKAAHFLHPSMHTHAHDTHMRTSLHDSFSRPSSVRFPLLRKGNRGLVPPASGGNLGT